MIEEPDSGSLTISEIATYLADAASALPVDAFPNGRAGAALAGLYAWRSDESGLDELYAPFGARLPALIYAGQAGASTSRQSIARASTLQSRIKGNHLGGNVGSSTFRKTLTAVLMEPLDLRLENAKRLESGSNRRLSAWMRAHLRIAIVGIADRGVLAQLESDVLDQLDPPLNLMGMRATATRATLKALRADLARKALALENGG